jgi:hypothetical protein
MIEPRLDPNREPMSQDAPRDRRGFRVIALGVGILLGAALLEALGAAGLAILETRRPRLPADLQGTVLIPGQAPRLTPDPYLLYRVRPGEQRAHYRSNSLGLRGRETPVVAPPGSFRVLLLGGSVAYGYNAVDDDATLAMRLERLLDQSASGYPALAGRRVEVLNGGVPSYVAWQEALAYSHRWRPLRPDAVVLLDGVNDVVSAIRLGAAGLPMRFDPDQRAFGKVRLTPWLRDRWSRLWFRELTRALWPRTLAEYPPPPVAEVVTAWRRALEHVADIARADASLALVVLQPSALLPDSKPLTEFERALVEHNDRAMPGQNAYFIEAYAAMRRMLAELAAGREDLGAFDATGVFAGEPAVCYTDAYHLTLRGDELLAQAMRDALLRRLDARR